MGRSKGRIGDSTVTARIALLGLAFFSLGFLVAVALEKPLESVYGGYKYIRIYEDGSYEGVTVDGQHELGCIRKALCND